MCQCGQVRGLVFLRWTSPSLPLSRTDFDTAFPLPPRHPPLAQRFLPTQLHKHAQIWGKEIESGIRLRRNEHADILDARKQGRSASVVRVRMQDASLCLGLPREGERHTQEDKTSWFIRDNGDIFRRTLQVHSGNNSSESVVWLQRQ